MTCTVSPSKTNPALPNMASDEPTVGEPLEVHIGKVGNNNLREGAALPEIMPGVARRDGADEHAF